MSQNILYTVDLKKFYSEVSLFGNELSKAEAERAARFVRESDARAYTISHCVLRRVLGDYLNGTSGTLQIAADTHGKPYLVDHQDNVHFNLSHSGDYAVIAISDGGPVGVDIEQHSDRGHERLAIAARFFTPQEYRYIKCQQGQQQLEAFYEIWTAKEAYVKAIGRGLAYGLDKFSVIDDEKITKSVDNWSLQHIDVEVGYSTALVVPSKLSDDVFIVRGY
ncbi:MAG: hypothetical protein COB66_04295 [Coxiella sp. (in: Bacteria)]|nr:MAG: hypothetical protein COB66_04295 [Coxiella sp. (in: g-proteobacteria)]